MIIWVSIFSTLDWCFPGWHCQVAAPTWTHTRSYRTLVTFNKWKLNSIVVLWYAIYVNNAKRKTSNKTFVWGDADGNQTKMNAYEVVAESYCPFNIHWFNMMIQARRLEPAMGPSGLPFNWSPKLIFCKQLPLLVSPATSPWFPSCVRVLSGLLKEIDTATKN